MGASGKFLFLFVAIIALQGICAWPYFNIWKWKNLGYEINKASDDAEREVRKDVLNVKNNIWKDTNKMIMKAKDSDYVKTCIVKTQQEFLMEVDKVSVSAFECIEKLRAEADAVEDEKHDPRELILLRNEMKNKVKVCRNTAKDYFKLSQKGYPAKVIACLESTRYPSEEEEDSSRSL